jgi:hypothetical protein
MKAWRSRTLAKLLVAIPLLLPAPLHICKCRLAAACLVAQAQVSAGHAADGSASHKCGKCGTKNTGACPCQSPGHRCNCMGSPTDPQGLILQPTENINPAHNIAFANPVQASANTVLQAVHAAAAVYEYPPGANPTPLYQLNPLLRI